MGAEIRILVAFLALAAAVTTRCAAQLRQDYYAAVCPDLESIVREAMTKKFQETSVTVGATIRLFFRFVESGGPSYAVEIGRMDGLSSTATSVDGNLQPPSFNLDQLTTLFAANNLSQFDMIALSAAHTVGFAHCSTFADRIQGASVDPTMDAGYASQLQAACPAGVDPNIALQLDPVTPRAFDNQYFINLQKGMGLFTSDQVLYSDARSRPTVDAWASNSSDFEQAFVAAMTNLGRVGVKTDQSEGNIRRDCAVLN